MYTESEKAACAAIKTLFRSTPEVSLTDRPRVLFVCGFFHTLEDINRHESCAGWLKMYAPVVDALDRYADDGADRATVERAAEGMERPPMDMGAAHGWSIYNLLQRTALGDRWNRGPQGQSFSWDLRGIPREWALAIGLAGACIYYGFSLPEKNPGGSELEPIASLVRDIVGRPSSLVTPDPDWLTSTVTQLAAAIYQDRAFDSLPILADALEDAGCDNSDILAHCRGPEKHVRGCWVIDLLLGK